MPAEDIELAVAAIQLPAKAVELAVAAVQFPSSSVKLAVSLAVSSIPCRRGRCHGGPDGRARGRHRRHRRPDGGASGLGLPAEDIELAVAAVQLPAKAVELALQHVVCALQARLRVRARAQGRPAELLHLSRRILRVFELLAKALDLIIHSLQPACAWCERRSPVLRSGELLAKSLHLLR